VQTCEKSQTSHSIGESHNISLKRGQVGLGMVLRRGAGIAPNYAVALACDGSLQLLTRCNSGLSLTVTPFLGILL
jgi:hypothetical protein